MRFDQGVLDGAIKLGISSLVAILGYLLADMHQRFRELERGLELEREARRQLELRVAAEYATVLMVRDMISGYKNGK